MFRGVCVPPYATALRGGYPSTADGKWKEEYPLLSTFRPLWTDNLLAKRRRAAYGGTQTARNTSAPPSKLITLLKPLICFRVPTRLAKQSMCDTHCRQNRVGQRRNRPRLRGIRLTYAESKRVADGARTRDLRSHKSNEACPARPSVSVKVLICRYFVRREIQYRPLHTNSYQPGCSTVAVRPQAEACAGMRLSVADKECMRRA